MKVAILGYGKMGKLIEELALREGWQVGPRLDIDTNAGARGITRDAMEGVDVAFEFSQPEAVLANVEAAGHLGLNLVVGTTGWLDSLDRIARIVQESGIGLIYGSNFSIGMNLFYAIVAQAAPLFAGMPQYDPFLAEQHHRAKKDAPSGTAIRLQQILAKYYPGRAPAIASTRAGFMPGNHTVGFDSPADTILLEHRARNRQGLAEGAILAAKWITGKKGLFEFHDVFARLLQESC